MTKKPILVKLIIFLLIIATIKSVIKYFVDFSFYQDQLTVMIRRFSNIYITPMGVLSLIAAIGTWLGKKWGWWLGAVYYLFALLWTIASTAYLIWQTTTYYLQPNDINTRFDTRFCIMEGTVVFGHLLILIIFFQDSVLEYFGLQQQAKIKAILILISIGLTITAIFFASLMISDPGPFML